MENVKWWTQRIDVRELREYARDLTEEGNDDGKFLMNLLKGKRGKLNYVDAGGWNSGNEAQRVLSCAGSKILVAECR